jgi:O-succinylbenzoate synthase
VRVHLPLLRPHRDVHRAEAARDAVLVRVEVDGVEGWGECGALSRPGHWHEWTDGAWVVLRDLLAPAALRGEDAQLRGHPMALAALKGAMLDARLRAAGCSLAEHLGAAATRVPAGAVVSPPGPGTTEEVATLVAAGFQRVKVKVGPGDVGRVVALRRELPTAPLAVDANGSFDPYRDEHQRGLDRLDEAGLICIEQPHPPDDLTAHAATSSRLGTPLCLDEPVTSPAVVRTIAALGAAAQVCLKPPRLGGAEQAVATARAAAEAGLTSWVGSLLETGVGRSVNLAVAAATGDVPGDLAPSARHFDDDITPPIEMEPGGWLPVPREPGASPLPRPDRLEEVAVNRCLLRP